MPYSERQVAEDTRRWRELTTGGILDAITAGRVNEEEVSALLELIRQPEGRLSKEHCERQIKLIKKNYKYHPVGDPESKLILEDLKAFVAICAKYFTKTETEFHLLKAELKGGAGSAVAVAPGTSAPYLVSTTPAARPISISRYASAAVPAFPGAGFPVPPPKRPPNFLWPSVACLVFCCFPFAIPAIIKGVRVNSCHAAGDYPGAEKASRSARLWIYVSIVAGILFNLFSIGMHSVSTLQNASRNLQRRAPAAPQTQQNAEPSRPPLTIGEILTGTDRAGSHRDSSDDAAVVLDDGGGAAESRHGHASDAAFHLALPPLEHNAGVLTALFSPDNRRLVTASSDRSVRVWDTETGQPVGRAMLHSSDVASVRFIESGTQLVTSNRDVAQVWDTETGNTSGTSMRLRYGGRLVSLAFCPSGCHIAISGKDNTALLWKIEPGEPVGSPIRHDGLVNSAEFSPDGRWVITASEDRTAQIWKGSTGERAGHPLVHDESVRYAFFTTDGSRIVTIAGRAAQVWDAATGKSLGGSIRHDYELVGVAASSDGRRIVTAGTDNVQLWSTDRGDPIGKPVPHTASVQSAIFSPDGRMMLACLDNTVVVLNTDTGEPIGAPLQHRGRVSSAGFSPNGRWIATASEDKTARIWKVPSSLIPTALPTPVSIASSSGKSGTGRASEVESIPSEFTASASKPVEAVPSPPLAEEKMEVWNDIQGRTLIAALLRNNGTSVVLKDSDGNEREVPLAALSLESRNRALATISSVDLQHEDGESMTLANYEQLYRRIIREPDLGDAPTAKLMAAANAGDHEAEALVGESFYDGLGTFPVNRVEALKWFVRSAKGGNALGRLWIALMTQSGEITASEPPQALFQRALPDLVQIIAHQNPSAPYWRATAECYAGGQGIALSARQPRELLEKAIERDDARARLLRGNQLVESNGSVGASYLRNSSDAGCATASTSLAKYYLGRGLEPQRASTLLRIAANKNDIEAQILLGSCFATGTGTNTDPAAAAFWLQLALLNSIQFANKNLETKAKESIERIRSKIGNEHLERAEEFFSKKGSIGSRWPFGCNGIRAPRTG